MKIRVFGGQSEGFGASFVRFVSDIEGTDVLFTDKWTASSTQNRQWKGRGQQKREP